METGPRIYNLFPSLAGPVDAWSRHVPRIAAMGFDWIYVNPFHETGYSGSLYAVKDFYRLNPLFRAGTDGSDDDRLRDFVDGARAAGISVMMDLVVNHTARDAQLTHEHPDWYRRDADGAIVSPSAIDPSNAANVTVWTDLAELDYAERPQRADIVAYFKDVVRHYAGLGFRGFRCDAAYKLPGEVWAELIAAVRDVVPGAVFAAETLGAPLEAVAQLRPAGFDLLFNSSKWWDFRADWLLDQYERFRHIAPSIAFPESHDTPRLAAELGGRSDSEIEAEYRFRYLFAAFFSTGVMMPIGYEFGFERPLDVVMTRPDRWETPRFDISAFIRDVNAMKAGAPALNREGRQRRVMLGDAVGLVRHSDRDASVAVALLNPDPARPAAVPSQELLRAIEGAPAAVDITPAVPRRPPPNEGVVLGPLQMRIFASGRNGKRPPPVDRRPVVIERVWPEIDAGRFAVKRIVGDRLTVSADIFREGHDLVAAALRYREAGAGAWHEVLMAPLDSDRRHAAFTLERNARYEYTLTAWPDTFESWRRDTLRKRDAGQDIALDTLEGRALLDAAVGRASPPAAEALRALAAACDAAPDDAARADLLLAAPTAAAMSAAPDRSHATTYERTLSVIADRPAARFAAWYELFPRSQGERPGEPATFAQAARRLPALGAMGFDVVYLPPIHPIGHAFRKGPNNRVGAGPDDPGSPWAIGNAAGGHMAVEPALGTLADFDAFVAAAHANGLEVALDYALQCSPDHPYVREHPEWFTFRPDGSIKYAENPPKKYQDIVNFNWYGPHAAALWSELRDVVDFWIEHGVRTFRVDNPHTKPFAFWEWLIGDVQSRRPDVLFLAEAFTRPTVMKELAKRGFSQSYTYFTWRNFKTELTDYVNELAHDDMGEYYRPNFFANTPDILPPFLQTGGRPAFRIRLVLAATLSGVYGIYSGFELCENEALPGTEEYANSEKYELRFREWDRPGNLNAEIAALNRLRRENPALQDWRNVRFGRAEHDDVLFYVKTAGANAVLVVVNLNPFARADVRIHLPLDELGVAPGETFACEELLSGARHMWRGEVQTLQLDPQVAPAAIFRIDRRLNVAYDSPSD